MYVKESDCHRNDHRQHHDTYKKTCYQEQGAAELAEDRYHQSHIASEAKNAGISFGEFGEVHHLVKSMGEEHDTEEDSEDQNEKGHTLSSEMSGE